MQKLEFLRADIFLKIWFVKLMLLKVLGSVRKLSENTYSEQGVIK